MRAAWVSYIEINELLKSCKTAEKAKQAIDKLMSRLAQCNLNTVFFHVRANSDAYYSSDIFRPASTVKSLLGKGFDPLAYAVEAAHKNQLQIHAWINPYRVGTNKDYIVSGVPTFSVTANNVTRYYYVPTSSATQKLVLDGVREILNRYAVDGIQYDDYFYPEGTMQESTAHDFESAEYTAYLQSGGKLRWFRQRISWQKKRGEYLAFLLPPTRKKRMMTFMPIALNGWPKVDMWITYARNYIPVLSMGVVRLINWWKSGCRILAIRRSNCMSALPLTKRGSKTIRMPVPERQSGQTTPTF